jgi:hypothetical protein
VDALRRHQAAVGCLSPVVRLPEGGETIPDAGPGWQEAVGANGGDAGGVPQRRGENHTLCLHLPAEAAQGDPVPVGQDRPQGPEDAGDAGGRAVGPP